MGSNTLLAAIIFAVALVASTLLTSGGPYTIVLFKDTPIRLSKWTGEVAVCMPRRERRLVFECGDRNWDSSPRAHLAPPKFTERRQLFEMALDGDRIALRLCLERIPPPRKSRPVHLPLPDMKTMDDVIAAQGIVARELASGELATDEAADIAKVLEVIALSMKTKEFEQRLAALEAKGTTDAA